MLDRTSGIYKILNIVNGKFYIGSAKDFYVRWSLHKSYLKSGKHRNAHLQASWNKYGEAAFEVIILEKTLDLKNREQYWIDLTKCFVPSIGYNIRKIADSNLGLKWSEKTKALMSKSAKGKKLTEETKLKMSKAKTGHDVTQETRNKISKANSGKIRSDQAKINMRVPKPSLRKTNKWPCANGHKCKCSDCRNKKNKYLRNWRKAA